MLKIPPLKEKSENSKMIVGQSTAMPSIIRIFTYKGGHFKIK
jgi:hypothetical protein